MILGVPSRRGTPRAAFDGLDVRRRTLYYSVSTYEQMVLRDPWHKSEIFFLRELQQK